MANALGIDVGEIYRTVEAVKASRANRALEERKHANTLATQELASNVVKSGGTDPNAMAQLAVLNPDAAKALTDAYTAGDERTRKLKRDELDRVGSLAATVLQSENPAAAYTELRNSSPELAKIMPPEYNAQWVQYQLAQATEADKLYDAIDGNRTAERDQANKLALQNDAQAATAAEGEKNRNNALSVADANRAASAAEKAADREFTLNRDRAAFKDDLVKIEAKAKADKGAAAGQIDSKDTAPIYKMSLELLGGVFDQQGNLQITDPAIRAKGQEIAARASKLWLEGAESHAAAVKAAAKELGIEFPGDAAAKANAGGDLTGDFLNILGQ